jgi:hypothetical protein
MRELAARARSVSQSATKNWTYGRIKSVSVSAAKEQLDALLRRQLPQFTGADLSGMYSSEQYTYISKYDQ